MGAPRFLYLHERGFNTVKEPIRIKVSIFSLNLVEALGQIMALPHFVGAMDDPSTMIGCGALLGFIGNKKDKGNADHSQWNPDCRVLDG